jgi:hypothetical protein
MHRWPIMSCWCAMALVAASVAAAERSQARRGDPRWLLPVPELQPDPRVPTLQDVVGHAWGREVTSYVRVSGN